MRFCIRLSGPIFGVKLNLHIYKTVKDFKTSSLTDIDAENVCIMKKTRGLYHVFERRYLHFSPGRFFGNCGYTYRAGCIHYTKDDIANLGHKIQNRNRLTRYDLPGSYLVE
jgi:hypothetical protein